MKEKHLKRTSNLLFIIHCVTMVFVFVGLMSQLTMSGMPPIRSVLPLIITIIVFISSIVMKTIKKGGIEYIGYVAIAMSVNYLILVVTGSSNSTFPYLIPFLIVFVLSLDKKSITISTVVFAVANIIRIIEDAAAAEFLPDALEGIMIEAIITVLVILASVRGSKLLIQFISDSIAEIEEASNKNTIIAQKIESVALKVKDGVDQMVESMNEISSSTLLMSETMDNIVLGTQNTADAISLQISQTNTIQDIIDDTHTKTKAVAEITDDTSKAVHEGMNAMGALADCVEDAKNINSQMQEAADALKENANEVRGITDIILSISSETNLLALNASIEAARAGDAGRGFAVVADEIRKLAEQTRQETENITRIVNSLGENADKVELCINKSAESVLLESENANNVEDKFKFIEESLDNLVVEVNSIGERTQTLIATNNEIIDTVSTLSATSEEISSSAAEAGKTSNNNVSLVNEFSESLKEIASEVDELANYAL